MPTYEYACQSCNHEFEQFQSMKDAPLKKCPKCGAKKLKRLVGRGAGLIFKGTGFYITDYKKKTGGDSKPGEAKDSPSGTKLATADSKSVSTSAPAKPAVAPAKK